MRKVMIVIFMLLNSLRKVCIAFWCLCIFGDVYVFLVHTTTLLCDVCFVRIINECCHNIILSAYVTYLLYYKHETFRCWASGFLVVSLGSVFFGTSVSQSGVEPPGSRWTDFGTPGSRIMLGLVSTSPWLIVASWYWHRKMEVINTDASKPPLGFQ